jgi:hypothetical protein
VNPSPRVARGPNVSCQDNFVSPLFLFLSVVNGGVGAAVFQALESGRYLKQSVESW